MNIKVIAVIIFVIVAIAALPIIIMGVTSGFRTSAFVAGEEQQGKIIGELTGVEQLPPVNDSSAIGVAKFKLGQHNV